MTVRWPTGKVRPELHDPSSGSVAALTLGAFALACGALLAAAPGVAAAKCKVARVVELPITMNSLRPTIVAKINNRDARFVLDSGAFYSMISAATAAEYGL